MRLRLTLLLLCFALPAYADTYTATVNRDNGVTQTTEPLVLTPANIGAVKAADFKVKNLLSAPYNIKNDGTDQGAAINAILAAAVDGDTFYLPAGTYGHSVPIVLPDKMVKVYGDGPHATFFKALSPMARSVYRAASANVVYRCELSNLGILGEKKSNYGVEIQAWKQSKINRLYIEDVLLEGMLLGQNGTSGANNMFYGTQLSEIEVYQKTGSGWLPDPSLRMDKGIHLLNSASDNDISRIDVGYAKTCGLQDEAFGNNRYSHVHPWGTPAYPMQYGMMVAAYVSISQGEFDINSVAGVKLTSNYGGVTVVGSQFINGTPTGTIIQDNTPNVFISGNYYDSYVTTPYTIYGAGTKGTNFTFIDKSVGIIPGLASNTTGTAAGLSADIPESRVTNLVSDLAGKQASLVSGTNIKTVNGNSLLGSGDIAVVGGGGVGSGTAGQLAKYLSDGTAVSGYTLLSSDITAALGFTPGTVTGVTGPSADLTFSGTTAVTSAWANQTTNKVFASPNGSTGAPSFRALVPADMAAIQQFAGPLNVPQLDSNGILNLYWSNKSLGFVATNAGANSTAYYPFMKVINYSNGTAGNPYFYLRNSGGNTTTDAASPSGQNLGDYRWAGRGATGDKTAANITAVAEAQFTDADQPTSIKFSVGGTGSSGNPPVKMTLDSSGKLAVTGEISAKTFTPTIPAATTYAATTTIDLAAGDSPSVTLTGNPTLAFSNPKAGQWHRLNIVQGASGGPYTVTWPSTGLVCTWRNTSGHTAPTLLTAANAVDTIVIHALSTTSAECWTAGNQ